MPHSNIKEKEKIRYLKTWRGTEGKRNIGIKKEAKLY
jgi:hypothetical protein